MGIRINLIGQVEEDVSPSRVYVVMYAASVAGLFFLILLLRFISSSELSVALERKEELAQQLAQLEKKTKEVQDLEARRGELNKKLEVIARLKLSKRGPIRMLNDLNIAIPDKLWLNEMKEVGNKLEISGLALDNPPIVDFMKNLERSEYFLKVDLGRSDQGFLVRETSKTASASRSGGRSEAQLRGFKKSKTAAPDAEQVFVLKAYEQLQPDQKQAFQQDRPGAGLKVRVFTLNADITYVGRSRLKALADLAAEENKKSEPAAKKGKK